VLTKAGNRLPCAIAATMRFGSVNYEAKTDAKGERLIRLDVWILNRLAALCGPGESYNHVSATVGVNWQGFGQPREVRSR
jgi:hypothetical protein